jgi:hypothetical protein
LDTIQWLSRDADVASTAQEPGDLLRRRVGAQLAEKIFM